MNQKNNLFFQVTLFIFLFLIQYPAYDHLFLGGDAGEYINNFYRLSYGDLPYRDFWSLYPPGEVYFPVFFTSIFGFKINFILLLFIAINAWMGIIVYQIGRLLFERNIWFSLFLMALIFGNGYARYGSANFIPMHFLFILFSIKSFIRFLKSENFRFLFFTGIFLGLAFLFRIFLTGAVFMSLLLVSFYFLKDKRIKVLKNFIGGISLVLLPVVLLLHQVLFIGLKEILFESVAHASNMNLSFWELINVNFTGIFSDLKSTLGEGGLSRFPKAGIHIIRFNIFLMYFIPFIIPLITIYLLVKGIFSKYQKQIILTFLFIGLFTLPKSLGRSDIQHIYQPGLPILILVAYLIYLFRENTFTKTRFISPLLKFIGLFLVLSNLVILTKVMVSFKTPAYSIKGDFGHFKTPHKEQAEVANKILNIIRKNTEKGDFIFVTPWQSLPYYALTERKNPTYFDSLIDLVARPSDEKQIQICEDLLKNKTQLIIHFTTWEFDGNEDLHFDKNCKVLIECIDEHFAVFEKVGKYQLYRPK